MIPVWLQQYVGGKEKAGFRGAHVSWAGVPLSERMASGNSNTLGTVCAHCNNGWMSRLENDFGTLLPDLQADMSPRRFSKTERHTIAMWIVKTGIIAHRSANYRSILPTSVPRALLQGASIPAGIKVFGGEVQSGKTILWVQSNIALSRVLPTDLSTFDAAKHTFVFLLSIMNIFIGFGWHGLDQHDFEILYSGNSTHHIYPHPKAARHPRVFENLRIAATEISLRRRRA